MDWKYTEKQDILYDQSVMNVLDKVGWVVPNSEDNKTGDLLIDVDSWTKHGTTYYSFI